MMEANSRFYTSLVNDEILSRNDVDNLNKMFGGNSFALLELLIEGGSTSRQHLCKLWGDSIGKAYVDLNRVLFQTKAVTLISMEFALEHKVIPVYKIGSTVTLACANPNDEEMIKKAGNMVGFDISTVFSMPDEIEDAIGIQYQTSSKLDDFIERVSALIISSGTTKITEDQIKEIVGEEAMIEFSKSLLLLSLKERASDIHIEPGEAFTKIRLRIDGVCHDRLKIESKLHNHFVARFKVMSELDITEKRLPQDGRILLEMRNKSVDFRLSIIPTMYGERVNLRLIGTKDPKSIPELEDLVFSKDNYDKIVKASRSPGGIFFVTGPTGSGKTTSLYSILKRINDPERNILTIEDPIEYRLDGISQSQVHHAIGLDFAKLLRAFLRQDPDVILIGETRDEETARVAVQAALTGHLVFSTMHTNSSIQAVTRLLDIGLEPYIVAPSLIGVMSQRLVRRICEHCKEKYPMPSDLRDSIFHDGKNKKIYIYRGKGCPECQGTGYQGRLALHEVLTLDSEIKRLIIKDSGSTGFHKHLEKTNYRSMRYDGIKKVLRGLTTIEEVDKVAISDYMFD